MESVTLVDTDIYDVHNTLHRLVVEKPAGCGSWFVMVDRYFTGQIVQSPGAWLPFINTSLLYSDDIMALADMVNSYEAETPPY